MRIIPFRHPFFSQLPVFFIALLVELLVQNACAATADDQGEKGVPAARMAPVYRLDADIPGECERLSRLSYPQADQPSTAQAQDLRGCEAYQYYFGIGRRKDYVKARLCAFSQPVPDSGVSGGWILMMLYANGQGVPRNPELAKRAACGAGLSVDELKESIATLRKMQVPAMRMPKKFEFCDLTASERSFDLCKWIKAQADIQKSESQLKPKRRTWTRLQQAAFDELQKKWTTYIDLHADLEERRVGDNAVIHRRSVVAREKAQFLDALLAFETGDYPSYDEEAYKAIDSDLNENWKTGLRPDLLSDTQTVDGVRRTQRAWLAYREAWVKFAASRYGSVVPDAWRAYFTRARMSQLGWTETAD